jgi:hypothetical protein
MANDEVPDHMDADPDLVRIFDRLVVIGLEINILLRVAACGGNPVPVDITQRIDSLSGNEYTEIIINGYPRRNDEDDESF